MAERLRWWIASQLDRLPGQCWADLVSWVLGPREHSPWSPVDGTCRADLARTGTCYCGKLRQAVTPDG